MANSLTLVGWMRVSIGPAIRVSVAGRAGWLSSDMIAAAASADTEGWQIATMCDARAELVEEGDQMLGVIVEAELAVRRAECRADCASR